MTNSGATFPVEIGGHGPAAEHAAGLLSALGFAACRRNGPPDLEPSLAWAHSGAMALSGRPDGPPRLAPLPLASCAEGALRALRALAGGPQALALDAAALLGERAALLGLERGGAVSPGGSCRMLECRDGHVAVNLPRADDLALLPAWLAWERPAPTTPPWRALASTVRGRASRDLVDRARLLGLAVAPATAPPQEPPAWLRLQPMGARVAARTSTAPRAPVVIDLSTLWAGPLCGDLLRRAGATVVKVESTKRPDGARRGERRFFDLLNAGKASVALDLGCDAGVASLLGLLERADIVLESARPRGLEQLGIDATAWLAASPGRSWVSITGHGRSEPERGWVAFGDDAAVAAGLRCVAAGPDEEPLFCGDAVADPLTGLHAAVAALAAHRSGGGALVELALRDVVAHAFGLPFDPSIAETVGTPDEGFEVRVAGQHAKVSPPRTRTAAAPARALGADNAALLGAPAARC